MANSLLDRIGSSDHPKGISSHAFSAGLYILGRGLVTRNQFVSRFELTANEEVQLDELLTYFSGLSEQEQLAFHGLFESLNVLREEGYITTEEYKVLLGVQTSNRGGNNDV